MKIWQKGLSVAVGVAACAGGHPAKAQLPRLVPPVEVSAGAFTTTGGNDDSGFAARATVAVSLPTTSYGVAASAWYLDGKHGNATALTGEFRKRFGPLSVGYWALGGGVGNSSDRGPLRDGALWTLGIGATLAGLSVEGRVLSSFKGGDTGLMGLVGYRF